MCVCFFWGGGGCGGGVLVGILSLALRTSTACEIYGSHGSDCEEHVF